VDDDVCYDKAAACEATYCVITWDCLNNFRPRTIDSTKRSAVAREVVGAPENENVLVHDVRECEYSLPVCEGKRLYCGAVDVEVTVVVDVEVVVVVDVEVVVVVISNNSSNNSLSLSHKLKTEGAMDIDDLFPVEGAPPLDAPELEVFDPLFHLFHRYL